MDEAAVQSFVNDAFDDFDIPSFGGETPVASEEETVELVAEPVQNTEEIAKEAVFAALNEVFAARGGSQAQADTPATAAEPAAKVSRVERMRALREQKQQKTAAKKAGRHAGGAEAEATAAAPAAEVPAETPVEPEVLYEEPAEPVQEANLARVATASGGRHAVAPKEEPAEVTPAVVEEKPEKRKMPKWKKKRIAAISGVAALALALAGVYAYGVYHFTSHFMPGTTVSGIDVSGMEVDEAKRLLDAKMSDYKVSVTGEDFYLMVHGEDIDYTADTRKLLDKVLAEADRFAWPLKMKATRTYDMEGYCTWDSNRLTSIVDAYVTAHNEGVTPPEDAYVAYSPEEKQFIVIPEIIGKRYQTMPIVGQVTTCLASMGTHVDLNDDSRMVPAVYSDDPDLQEDAEECNSYLAADFDLVVNVKDMWSSGWRVLDHIDGSIVSQWIRLEDGEVFFDEAAMRDWCRYYADSHYTYKLARTYTRPDGATVTQSGGTYGWNYDTDTLYNLLVNAILNGVTDYVVMPCWQTALVWVDRNEGDDFGHAYVDIDIPTQIVRYIVDGEEVLQAPTVSGDINSGQGTPLGVWYITRKLSPTHLRGTDPDGTPYDVPVQYWMAFIENSHGLHDNPNRSVFGWPWAFRDAGSHGCCNLPYAKAQALYSMIELGTPVIVHWG